MRTAIICDTSSLYRSVQSRHGGRVNYSRFLAYVELEFGYDLTIRVAYGNQKDTVVHKFISNLNSLGFQTHFKYGKDWLVEGILKAVSIVDKIDCLVLATNDPLLAPLVPWLESHGVKVHVISCNIPRELSQLALCHEIPKELVDVDSSDI